MRRIRDIKTMDLFEVPVPTTPLPGALNFGLVLRNLLSELLKQSEKSRVEIAICMSELTGETITKHQLDSWTAESREGWRFPLEYMPAIEVALETHAIGAWLADIRGGKLLVGREAIDAEIGRLERLKETVSKRLRELKQESE